MSISETDLDPFMKIEEVEKAVSLDRTTIWRLRRDGLFPEPVCISPGRVAWRRSQIIEWMAKCQEIFAERRRRVDAERAEARRRVRKPKGAGLSLRSPFRSASR